MTAARRDTTNTSGAKFHVVEIPLGANVRQLAQGLLGLPASECVIDLQIVLTESGRPAVHLTIGDLGQSSPAMDGTGTRDQRK